MTDDEVQVAKDKLNAAIKEYFATIEPHMYVGDWVLVAHKESIELSAEGQSEVSTLVPTGQAFHRTNGLLQLAAHNALGGA